MFLVVISPAVRGPASKDAVVVDSMVLDGSSSTFSFCEALGERAGWKVVLCSSQAAVEEDEVKDDLDILISESMTPLICGDSSWVLVDAD